MALTSTTLAAPCAANDTKITVASPTGFAVGNVILVENEVMQQTAAAAGAVVSVRRGLEGTVQGAHATAAFVATGLGSDFPGPTPGQEVTYGPGAPDGSTAASYTYSAAGAITPVAGTHVLNGAAAIAMTLAGPTGAQEGSVLEILSKSLFANTCLATPAFLGAAGATATFAATGGSARLKACGGKWTVIGQSGATFA
jgi:hypothetical protein